MELNRTNPPTRADIRRWRRYLAEERHEADTYRILARQRTGVEREILEKLVAAEQRHERHWLELLGEHALPQPKAPLRARILNRAATNFGSIFVLALMQRTEERCDYDSDADAPDHMAADEHIHGEVVRALAAQRREQMSGSLRAAVFGANDGLVSNIALIVGMAGTGATAATVTAAGTAGLIAGALSMAAGEYISVQSQRELLQSSAPSPHADVAIRALNLEENELELVFLARGDDPAQARAKARATLENLAVSEGRAEAGANPTATAASAPNPPAAAAYREIGSAWAAAVSSFIFFALGAAIPLIPWLLPLAPAVALGAAIIAVGIALMLTGGVVGLLSGVAPAPRALRQLAIGYGAAAVTYCLGLAFGTVTG